MAARDDLPAGALVLGCDSVLELDGAALGKPARRATTPSAAGGRCAAAPGVLHTGHCLHDAGDRPGRRGDRVDASCTSPTLTDDEIEAYVATGEPLQVAGAFTVDGLGGAFVTGIEGDHHNVVGVSLPLVRELVAELGHSWTALWHSASCASSVADTAGVPEHPGAEQVEPRRGAQGQPDHVRREVVRERVVQAQHVAAQPQAAHGRAIVDDG